MYKCFRTQFARRHTLNTHTNENNWQSILPLNYPVNICLHYNDSSKAAIRSLCMFMSICPAIWKNRNDKLWSSTLFKWKVCHNKMRATPLSGKSFHIPYGNHNLHPNTITYCFPATSFLLTKPLSLTFSSWLIWDLLISINALLRWWCLCIFLSWLLLLLLLLLVLSSLPATRNNTALNKCSWANMNTETASNQRPLCLQSHCLPWWWLTA